jgi:succinate dehydrogenase/fumarate reductase flavoprotein subunit
MDWNELVVKKGLPRWPYPVRYGEEERISADVLVLGGGIAGCWAAISAARGGAKVVMVEKGATLTSGAGGTGCDHWLNTPNPCSRVTAEEAVEWESDFNGGYVNGISRYIAARESFETLLEMEKMGGKIRDTGDEFKGAPFRDEKTKFLFAYDYESKYHFRIWGSTFKPALYKECKRLGVKIYDRIMATGLLTEGGKTGKKVVGATGIHTRTGGFILFKSKAVVNCMSRYQRNWSFSTEWKGISSWRPPQIAGDGHAMAWRAGVEFTLMEISRPSSFGSGYSYPGYGVGNALNTWVPCTLVDANGKEVPWVDRDGRVLTSLADRTRPAPGQKFMGERTTVYKHKRPEPITDLEQRVKKGEFVLPIYADLTGMPEYERRVIWGVMVGEEGKTKIPVFRTYHDAGFDPEKDLLQSYLLLGGDPMRGKVLPWERTAGELGDAGGPVVDWNLMTNVEGLYVAGDALFASNYHNHAAATGRYAGRKAAQYASNASLLRLSTKQVKEEKERVYEPVRREGDLEWKEFNIAISRVMQNYCGEYKNDELLKIGSIWLEDLRENEAPRVCADNPHKLVRTLEVFNVLTCSQMILHASMARKASSRYLDFLRLDYPEMDPPEWHKWVTIRIEDGHVKKGERRIDYWGDLAENYERNR